MGVAYVYYTKPNEKRSVNRVYRDLSTLISRRSQKKKKILVTKFTSSLAIYPIKKRILFALLYFLSPSRKRFYVSLTVMAHLLL